MSEIQILVVEDEPIIADDLVFMLEEMGYSNVDTVHYGEYAIKDMEQKPYDLLLLDINLEGKIDGIQVAEHAHINHAMPYIFLTSLSDEKTIERVKKTHPAAYLVKPIDEKDLKVNIELTLAKSTNKKAKKKEFPSIYYIKDRSRMSKVRTEDILYLEGSNNYTIVHTTNKKYVISQTLKRVAEAMDPELFIRIHKSAIVQLSKIDEIVDAHVILCGIKLAIGRTYRSRLMERLDTI
ncbi:MAG: response regulator [Saprospiraceae bacterium]|nr:response regulator [Saprospiraceae bacterium]